MRVKADWLRTVATPIIVTRSEDRWRVPLGLGAFGAVAGFCLFVLLRVIHKDDLLVDERWVLVGAAAVSVTVGAGSAYFTNYWNQDVWTWQDNGLALFTAAVSASTAGVAAGLLAGLYRSTSGASQPAKEMKKAKARVKTAKAGATTPGQPQQQVVIARSEPPPVRESGSTQQPPET